MRIINLFAVVFVIVLAGHLHAATKTTKMKLSVNYGDKNTVFEIPDAKKLDVVVNGRKRKTLRGNVERAIKLAAAASKEKSNDMKLCSRKYIELRFTASGAKETRIYGCIGSKTPAAVKLTELSNLMIFM